jgi:hypothetical protein
MQMGQRTVRELVGASTEIGTHRLQPLQRTTWTRFGSGVGISAQSLTLPNPLYLSQQLRSELSMDPR